MNRISPNIQTLQISLRTFFVIVTIAAVLCMIAGNWESIICRIKYGNPTDLSSVAIVGINDDAYILEIDGQRVHTLSSHTVALANFQALTGASDAIFENVHAAREKYKDDPEALEISVDTKAKVSLGEYVLGGKNTNR